MAKKADEQALRIRAAFEAKGCKVLHDSPTNQQFFVLPDEWYDKLAETYAMTHMGKPDKHHTAVRVCTSWATKDEAVEQLIADVNGLSPASLVGAGHARPAAFPQTLVRLTAAGAPK